VRPRCRARRCPTRRVRPRAASGKKTGDTTMQRQRRTAFTLIELIVVIAIIAVLAGMVYMIGPVLQRSQAASRGAEMVQSQLFNAKQIALRDKALYGIRLLP